ncbi:MAG: GNAT family N-acetyltransferase, partial [Parvularculaceae bacterium]
MTLNIRKAEREDAALILRFIGELAVYEKLADDVVASVDDI